MPKKWKAMIEAPRDGTVIIALYSDHSGVIAIRWGVDEDDESKESWFSADYEDEADQDNSYAGWIHSPSPERWDKLIPAKKNKRKKS